MNSYNFLFKYIIIGDTNIGKSCMLLQFTESRFKQEHDATIGVEFGSKTINLRDKVLKIQIWDTAGQESFRAITRSYYRGSIGVMLVYDITKRESFENLSKWLSEIQSYAHDKIEMMVIGNKADLNDKREVPYEDGEQFAKKNNFEFIEVSAKTGYNIEQAFQKIADKILKKIEKNEIDLSNENCGIKIGTRKKGNKDSMTQDGNQLNGNEEHVPKQSNCC